MGRDAISKFGLPFHRQRRAAPDSLPMKGLDDIIERRKKEMKHSDSKTAEAHMRVLKELETPLRKRGTPL